ncbi:MAG: 4Fe-4S dicluster domain-containing protein, partial [Roseobacter sp.]
TGQAAAVAYITMAILTATTFGFGGFAREQICIYACPWPRIQGAMMDEDTLTVAYRPWRGEPRKHSQEAQSEPIGDCIDCMACVNVCPVGIDIRDGQQMECITCALCIDACDDIMAKVGKQRGLIDYLALSDELLERQGNPPRAIWKHIFRPRTILYTALWGSVGVLLVVALFIRADIEVTVAPVRNPTFVTLSDGSIRNTYDIRLRNKNIDERLFRIAVLGDPTLRIQLEGTPYASMSVAADTSYLQRVYVVAPPNSAPATGGLSDVRFWIEDLSNGDRAYKDSNFTGKGSN